MIDSILYIRDWCQTTDNEPSTPSAAGSMEVRQKGPAKYIYFYNKEGEIIMFKMRGIVPKEDQLQSF